MTPKLVFTAVFIAFFNFSQAQEITHLSGDVTVLLKKKELSATYELTNITVNNPKMSFMLHEDFDVDQVYLNGDPIASSKNGRFCETCKVHTIWIDRPLTPQDTVKIVTEGDLENFIAEGINRPDKQFQMGTDAKWYPIILDEQAKKSDAPFASNKYAYTYNLQIKGDAKTVLLNTFSADDNVFTSDDATTDIQLLLSLKPLQQQTGTKSARFENTMFAQSN